jgi:hypothetical protein
MIWNPNRAKKTRSSKRNSRVSRNNINCSCSISFQKQTQEKVERTENLQVNRERSGNRKRKKEISCEEMSNWWHLAFTAGYALPTCRSFWLEVQLSLQ